MLSVLGFDGWRLMETRDPVEAMVLQAVGQEAAKVAGERDKNLAVEIANAVGKLFK